MSSYLPLNKGDRAHRGSRFNTPMMATLWPVTAYSAWTTLAGIEHGPVFRGIDRWGHIAPDGLHINSLVPLLRLLFDRSGMGFPEQYSGHSLRRGFAKWPTSNGCDIKTLMQYVGWKNMQSALRYIDGADPFAATSMHLNRYALSRYGLT